MANLELRMSPSGPVIGNPPVSATPNIASLIFSATGVNQVDSFAAVNQQPVWWTDTDNFVSVLMRAGYRYVIEARFGVKTVNATASANFKPRWNPRVQSTGAYAAADAAANAFNGARFSSLYHAAEAKYSGGVFLANFAPVVDYDRLKLLLEVDGGGVLADASLDSEACWVKVYELGGVLPPS